MFFDKINALKSDLLLNPNVIILLFILSIFIKILSELIKDIPLTLVDLNKYVFVLYISSIELKFFICADDIFVIQLKYGFIILHKNLISFGLLAPYSKIQYLSQRDVAKNVIGSPIELLKFPIVLLHEILFFKT